MIAQEIKKKIEKTRDPREMNRIAFEACVCHNPKSPSVGWGEMEEYLFRDGSVLTYDGRGYIASARVD